MGDDTLSRTRPTLKLKVSERVETPDAAAIIAGLAAGLRSGTIKIDRAGKQFSLAPARDVKLRLKASEGLSSDKASMKGRIKLRISWG